MAVGDINADGLEDVYLCQPGGMPNRLFLGGSTPANEVAAEAGLDILDSTIAALILDFDGDLDRDVIVALDAYIVIYRNIGGGRFKEAGRHPASNSTSMCAADIDGDGDVDVFVCGYQSPYTGNGTPLPYHDARNGQANLLLRNEGSLRFVDGSKASGLDRDSTRFSFAASFEDFDRDGDQDLYVANDFGSNSFYINDGEGRFTEAAEAYGLRDIGAGMGVAWSDFDGDGFSDLFVSNMYSSAGGRLTHQARFQSAADETVRGYYQRHARGNSLFLNDQGRGFRDGSEASGALDGGWAWGGIALDWSLDGFPDLVVPNGFLTGESTGPDL